jgi:hypothetical protein
MTNVSNIIARRRLVPAREIKATPSKQASKQARKQAKARRQLDTHSHGNTYKTSLWLIRSLGVFFWHIVISQ